MQVEMSVQEKFRFSSKREYERELSRLISLKNSLSTQTSKRKPKSSSDSLEEEYDLLMEEYLAFCSNERDG